MCRWKVSSIEEACPLGLATGSQYKVPKVLISLPFCFPPYPAHCTHPAHFRLLTASSEPALIAQLTNATSASAVSTSAVVSGRSMRCVIGRHSSQRGPLEEEGGEREGGH